MKFLLSYKSHLFVNKEKILFYEKATRQCHQCNKKGAKPLFNILIDLLFCFF